MIAILLLGVTIFSTIPSSSAFCFSRERGVSDAKRIEGFKREFLMRLGLPEAPSNLSISNIADQDLVDKFEIAERNENLAYHHKPCVNLDFHSLETLPYLPSEVRRIKPRFHSAFGDDCASKTAQDSLDYA